MAFLFKNPTSKNWQIGYYDNLSGKNRSKTTGTHDKAIARRILKDFAAKLQLQIDDAKLRHPDDHRYKFSNAFSLFLTQHSFKPKTKNIYSISAAHFIKAVGDKHLYKYDKFDGFKFVEYLNEAIITKPHVSKTLGKLSQNSKHNYSRHVHQIFNWLVEQELTKKNPVKKIHAEKKEVEIIREEDLEKIFIEMKQLNIKYWYFFLLKYLGAFRLEEVVQTAVEHYDFQNELLTILNFKGSKDKVAMVSDLREHLLIMPKPAAGRVFNNITLASAQSFWKRLMKTLGMNYHPHQLRKTRGTHLADLDINPLFLMDFMRHEDFNTTQQYYIRRNLTKAKNSINEKLFKKETEDKEKLEKVNQKSNNPT